MTDRLRDYAKKADEARKVAEIWERQGHRNEPGTRYARMAAAVFARRKYESRYADDPQSAAVIRELDRIIAAGQGDEMQLCRDRGHEPDDVGEPCPSCRKGEQARAEGSSDSQPGGENAGGPEQPPATASRADQPSAAPSPDEAKDVARVRELFGEHGERISPATIYAFFMDELFKRLAAPAGPSRNEVAQETLGDSRVGGAISKPERSIPTSAAPSPDECYGADVIYVRPEPLYVAHEALHAARLLRADAASQGETNG